MTKKEFLLRVSKMRCPQLHEGVDSDCIFLNRCWFVEDETEEELKNRFWLPGVRLSSRQYRRNDASVLEAYYRRETKTRERYVRWLAECQESEK